MQFDHLSRREVITLLGGAAVAWPLTSHAQQSERVRRVGVLTNLAADDPEAQVRYTAFAQALAQLGWTVGQNLQIEHRWAGGDAERIRKYAAELVALTRMSFWPLALPAWRRCCKQPARYRSC
jgi:hypothetical protein